MKLIFFSIFILFIVFHSCENARQESRNMKQVSDDTVKAIPKDDIEKMKNDTCELERIFIASGLVNINKYDSTIKVDLKYSGKENFLGIILYNGLKRAYLNDEAARKLSSAQTILKKKHAGYSLIVYDAARPLSISKMMWDSIKVPENQKKNFLSHPELGSMHNYGLAVDLSVIDESGKPIDMGTDFDCFDKLAYPMLEKQFLEMGKLSEEQYQNRLLLREAMEEAGFNHIQTEWWHFSIYSRQYARENYSMVISHKLPEKQTVVEEMKAGNDVQKEIERKIADNTNITFRVQILTSKQKIDLNDKRFMGLEIHRYKHNGIFKYTTGVFTDIEKAHEYQFKMWEKGFKDAFVAGFNNNERIGIYDAIELLELSKKD